MDENMNEATLESGESVGVPGFLVHERWWAVALRGLCALAFGVLALVWPGMTVEVLVILFGVFALAAGVLTLVAAVGRIERRQRVLMVLQGVLGIAAGLVALGWPLLAAVALLLVIAVWALVIGLFEIIAAIRVRPGGAGRWLLGLSGALGVILGILLLALPVAGVLVVVWLIAVYAIVVGIGLVALGFVMRGRLKQI